MQEQLEMQNKIIDQVICPISHERMEDPVIAPDGHTYDRKSIEKWFITGKNTSPITRERFSTNKLTTNYAIKNIIDLLNIADKKAGELAEAKETVNDLKNKIDQKTTQLKTVEQQTIELKKKLEQQPMQLKIAEQQAKTLENEWHEAEKNAQELEKKWREAEKKAQQSKIEAKQKADKWQHAEERKKQLARETGLAATQLQDTETRESQLKKEVKEMSIKWEDAAKKADKLQKEEDNKHLQQKEMAEKLAQADAIQKELQAAQKKINDFQKKEEENRKEQEEKSNTRIQQAEERMRQAEEKMRQAEAMLKQQKVEIKQSKSQSKNIPNLSLLTDNSKKSCQLKRTFLRDTWEEKKTNSEKAELLLQITKSIYPFLQKDFTDIFDKSTEHARSQLKHGDQEAPTPEEYWDLHLDMHACWLEEYKPSSTKNCFRSFEECYPILTIQLWDQQPDLEKLKILHLTEKSAYSISTDSFRAYLSGETQPKRHEAMRHVDGKVTYPTVQEYWEANKFLQIGLLEKYVPSEEKCFKPSRLYKEDFKKFLIETLNQQWKEEEEHNKSTANKNNFGFFAKQDDSPKDISAEDLWKNKSDLEKYELLKFSTEASYSSLTQGFRNNFLKSTQSERNSQSSQRISGQIFWHSATETTRTNWLEQLSKDNPCFKPFTELDESLQEVLIEELNKKTRKRSLA